MENIFYQATGLFSIFFIIVAIFIGAVFIFVIGNFIKIMTRRASEKRYNDGQPILTKTVRITGKRTIVSGGGESMLHTSYFVTFEFTENKERIELNLPSKEYGLLSEGDSGKLIFQGSRYHQFQRNL